MRKDLMVLICVNDSILISKDVSVIDRFITSLIDGRDKFVFTNEGTSSTYLGVDIVPLSNKEGFVLSQPHLIGRIIEALHFDLKTIKGARGNTPVAYPLLSNDENERHRKAPWKYRTLIGMFGYWQGTSRPDITKPIHQCATFNIDPRLSHKRAVKWIGRYLPDTKDKGLIFRPATSIGLECYVDADFARGWKYGGHDSPESALSRSSFVIMFISWLSDYLTKKASDGYCSQHNREQIYCIVHCHARNHPVPEPFAGSLKGI